MDTARELYEGLRELEPGEMYDIAIDLACA